MQYEHGNPLTAAFVPETEVGLVVPPCDFPDFIAMLEPVQFSSLSSVPEAEVGLEVFPPRDFPDFLDLLLDLGEPKSQNFPKNKKNNNNNFLGKFS